MTQRARWLVGLTLLTSCASLREQAESVAAYGIALRPSDPARLSAHGIEGACAAGSIAWVVPVDGGVVLVDAGFEDGGASVEAALRGRRVLAVLLTHAHLDHRAAAHRFRAPVYVGRRDVALLDGTYRYPHLIGALMAALGTPPPPREVVPVDDGFALAVGGRVFHAVAMPGHTPGSTAWLLGRTLFSGDAALSPFGDAIAPSPEGYSDDVVRAWDSLRRVSFLDVDELLDGHFGRTALSPSVWARSLARARVHAGTDDDAEVGEAGGEARARPWGCAPSAAAARPR